jgi:hypothetical protein
MAEACCPVYPETSGSLPIRSRTSRMTDESSCRRAWFDGFDRTVCSDDDVAVCRRTLLWEVRRAYSIAFWPDGWLLFSFSRFMVGNKEEIRKTTADGKRQIQDAAKKLNEELLQLL